MHPHLAVTGLLIMGVIGLIATSSTRPDPLKRVRPGSPRPRQPLASKLAVAGQSEQMMQLVYQMVSNGGGGRNRWYPFAWSSRLVDDNAWRAPRAPRDRNAVSQSRNALAVEQRKHSVQHRHYAIAFACGGSRTRSPKPLFSPHCPHFPRLARFSRDHSAHCA